jgi:mevalonate kinase
MAQALRNRVDYLHNREMGDTANLCADAAREIDRLVNVIRSRDKHIAELQSQLPLDDGYGSSQADAAENTNG